MVGTKELIMNKTHGKYTVHVLCQNNDVMVEEEVLAEEDHDSFKIAEEQHNKNCYADWGFNIRENCSSEGWRFEEGWNSDNE